jgi:hypothetical protein
VTGLLVPILQIVYKSAAVGACSRINSSFTAAGLDCRAELAAWEAAHRAALT